jgi:glycolate oxidase FAD binding subunit
MENLLTPRTPEELAEAVGAAGSRGEAIALAGAGSKRLMGGPVAPGLGIATTGLRRVRQYEPRDLTISVEAGLPWCELDRLLAENRQMIPLDPPFSNQATVGGVIAANSSGPRRKFYGTARDFVIGMQFATVEGKLVSSGGMVVKNVAGLDMAKLLTGSFGTLAAIASVNFKVVPRPACERSFLLPFDTAAAAAAARDAILKSPLQPAALDILTPPAAAELGASGFALVMEAAGNAAVIERCEREIASLGPASSFDAAAQEALWRNLRDFVPRFMASHPDGAVVRVSSTLKAVAQVLDAAPGPALARGGSGVCYICFDDPGRAAAFAAEAAGRDWKAVVEFAPEQRKAALDLWPSPGTDFDLMTRVKRLFDPKGLLNRGRMYGRI